MYLIFKCLDCNERAIYTERFSDGRRCEKCGGHLVPFDKGGKGISAMMGGWIIEAHVDGEGYIQKLITQKLPFYVAIKEDYKNWQMFNRQADG